MVRAALSPCAAGICSASGTASHVHIVAGRRCIAHNTGRSRQTAAVDGAVRIHVFECVSEDRVDSVEQLLESMSDALSFHILLCESMV